MKNKTYLPIVAFGIACFAIFFVRSTSVKAVLIGVAAIGLFVLGGLVKLRNSHGDPDGEGRHSKEIRTLIIVVTLLLFFSLALPFLLRHTEAALKLSSSYTTVFPTFYLISTIIGALAVFFLRLQGQRPTKPLDRITILVLFAPVVGPFWSAWLMYRRAKTDSALR